MELKIILVDEASSGSSVVVNISLEFFVSLLSNKEECHNLLRTMYYKLDMYNFVGVVIPDPTRSSSLIPDVLHPVKTEKQERSEKEQIMDEWEKIINESIV